MTLSTRSARLLPVRSLAAAADGAGLPGIDLDLDFRAFPAINRAGTPSAVNLPVGRVDSVWLPVLHPGRLSDRHIDDLIRRWVADASDLGVRSVVVDRDVAFRQIGQRVKQPVLLRLRENLPDDVRVVVVLRPRMLEGTRSHLNGLVTLRRTAEEWDFDLALDLLGPVDPRWEAEAAIQRLHPRLSLVRLPTIADDGPGSLRGRMTNRVVAYLLDQGYQGTISLVARVGITDLVRSGALMLRVRAEAGTLLARHQRLYGAAQPIPPLVARQETWTGDLG